MKINSRFVCILSALFVLAIMVTSVGAADNMTSDYLGSDDFKINVPSDSDFHEEATTNLKIAGEGFNMVVFENAAINKNDVDSVLYFKDATTESSIVADMIKDMKKDNDIVEETDKYVVLKTQKSDDWNIFGFDLGGFDDFANIFDGFFSGDSEVNVTADGSDVEVSKDGINVDNSENGTFSLSSKGLEVSDEDGSGISITDDGITFSDSASSNESSDSSVAEDSEANFTFNGNINTDIQDTDYVICVKNPENDTLIMITGNNLELMKSMADTASFK